VFLDTNVLIYLYSNSEPAKRSVVASAMERLEPVVSTQVLSEFANVMIRKLASPVDAIGRAIDEITEACELVVVTPATVRAALQICARYRYAFFDSQVLAAAIAADVRMLYSEDLQHGQVVEDVRIQSPFVPVARERGGRYRVRAEPRRAA
jgi:predicted nucleic acid-binding protein